MLLFYCGIVFVLVVSISANCYTQKCCAKVGKRFQTCKFFHKKVHFLPYCVTYYYYLCTKIWHGNIHIVAIIVDILQKYMRVGDTFVRR